mmetsp:Transcript_96273/g.267537  ORF Transcript_96273/g.267537 Transcript_96273/m.267537 type:complete len:158 (-) Transcript_96273:203-676(-)
MALLYHRRAETSLQAMDKAKQLYRLVIQVLQSFVLSLTSSSSPPSSSSTTTPTAASSSSSLDGTCMTIMLASLNNLSYLLYSTRGTRVVEQQHQQQQQEHQEEDEARRHIQFMARLLNVVSRQDLLNHGVLSEAELSSFMLNIMLADQRQFQSAPAA